MLVCNFNLLLSLEIGLFWASLCFVKNRRSGSNPSQARNGINIQVLSVFLGQNRQINNLNVFIYDICKNIITVNNLIKGDIFMYPCTTDKPKGKLRLLYECNPFAFILAVAGGKATNGKIKILDVQPTELHQRTPLFIGSKLMMEELETYLK